MDVKFNFSKSNNSLEYGESIAFWFLREDLLYNRINYTQKNAQLFGSHVNNSNFIT